MYHYHEGVEPRSRFLMRMSNYFAEVVAELNGGEPLTPPQMKAKCRVRILKEDSYIVIDGATSFAPAGTHLLYWDAPEGEFPNECIAGMVCPYPGEWD